MKTNSKKLWNLMVLTLCLTGMMTFTACDDDDDEVGGSSTGENTLVGNWEIVEDDMGAWTDNASFWNFYKDGTTEYPQIWDVSESDYLGSILDVDNIKNYAVNGKVYITLIWDWTLSGNHLHLKFNRLRIWSDAKFKKVAKEMNSSYYEGSVHDYQVEFLSDNRVKLVDTEVTSWFYILKRK